MGRGKAEDAGGLTPAKDNNAAPYHFDPRTLPIFMCVDYTAQAAGKGNQQLPQRLLCRRPEPAGAFFRVGHILSVERVYFFRRLPSGGQLYPLFPA